MKIITSVDEMQKIALKIRSEGKTIGFVPTMGYLHEGHLSLINHARKDNDFIILSIFVNPLQFGPNEDFDSYPRDIYRDEQLAEQNSVDYLFYPTTDEMYKGRLTTTVKVTQRVDVLCGRKREGHFDGVATVLIKLFNITQPHRAYFGMKDAQQVAVVDGLIKDYNFPIDLVAVETIREEDGLAKSSRNVYLTAEERNVAKKLYEALSLGKEKILQGERNAFQIKMFIEDYITNNTNGKIDYVEIYNYPELTEMDQVSGKIIIALAVIFTKARLIDNITFVV